MTQFVGISVLVQSIRESISDTEKNSCPCLSSFNNLYSVCHKMFNELLHKKNGIDQTNNKMLKSKKLESFEGAIYCS